MTVLVKWDYDATPLSMDGCNIYHVNPNRLDSSTWPWYTRLTDSFFWDTIYEQDVYRTFPFKWYQPSGSVCRVLVRPFASWFIYDTYRVEDAV